MSAFAGIDLSTLAVDVVYLEEDGRAFHERYPLSGHDAFERVRSVRDALPCRQHWLDVGVIAIGIEEPQGAQRATVAKLKAVQGAILACLPREIVVEPMVPARWRALVGLPGNATKEDVRGLATYELHGVIADEAWVWPQDACDAYCLAKAVELLTQEMAA